MKEYKYSKPKRQPTKLRSGRLAGGPWHGQDVKIPIEGTMVFTVGDYTGQYSEYGIWRDAGAPRRQVEVSPGRWVHS